MRTLHTLKAGCPQGQPVFLPPTSKGSTNDLVAAKLGAMSPLRAYISKSAARDRAADVAAELDPAGRSPGFNDELNNLADMVANKRVLEIPGKMGDAALSGQLAFAKATGTNLPLVGAGKAVKEARKRQKVWQSAFSRYRLPFSEHYLSSGADFGKPDQVRAAFLAAGKEIDDNEALAISVRMSDRYKGLTKEASPKWVKMLQSMSAEGKSGLAAILPASTRQVGKARIGHGTEGDVFNAFTGGHGDGVLKRFFRLAKNSPKAPPAWMENQVEGMRAFPQVFPKLHGSNPVGYSMERMSHNPPAGIVDEVAMGDLLDKLRPLQKADVRLHGTLRRAEAASGQRMYARPGKMTLRGAKDSPHAYEVGDAFGSGNVMFDRSGMAKITDPIIKKIENPTIERLRRMQDSKELARLKSQTPAATQPKSWWRGLLGPTKSASTPSELVKMFKILSRAKASRKALGADAADQLTMKQLGSVYGVANKRFYNQVGMHGITPRTPSAKVESVLAGLVAPKPAVGPLQQSVMPFMKQGCLTAALRRARNATHTHPTPAQSHAGNYRKGTLILHGMAVKIENPKGTERRGYDKDGNVTWKRTMQADYGYFQGTNAIDGDAVDCFIGPDPDSHFAAAVDQKKADGSFDETKFILGCTSQEQAEKLYLAHYPRGWKLGAVSTTTVQQLKKWLKEGDTKSPFKGQMVKAAAFGDKAWQERAALENAAIDRAVAAMEEGADKELAKKGHGVKNGSCGHRISSCRCSKHNIDLTLDIPCEDCVATKAAGLVIHSIQIVGAEGLDQHGKPYGPNRAVDGWAEDIYDRNLRAVVERTKSASMGDMTSEDCANHQDWLYDLEQKSPGKLDGLFPQRAAAARPFGQMPEGYADRFHQRLKSALGQDKAAALRPLSERMRRLRDRRGECHDCGKPNREGHVCDCGTSLD